MINGLLLVNASESFCYHTSLTCLQYHPYIISTYRYGYGWIGGRGLSGRETLTVERYNPERNEWAYNIPDLEWEHYGGASADMMNRMIVCGGGLDNVESYDPRSAQKKWTQMRPLPNEGRSHLSMITLNDYQALVIGGSSVREHGTVNDWGRLSLPIYELDIRGGRHQWITHDGSTIGNGGFPPLPYPMMAPSVTYLDNTLIIAHTAHKLSGYRHQSHWYELSQNIQIARQGFYLPCHPTTSRPLSSSKVSWLTFELPSTFRSSGLAPAVIL
jgi:hypothetical protein